MEDNKLNNSTIISRTVCFKKKPVPNRPLYIKTFQVGHLFKKQGKFQWEDRINVTFLEWPFKKLILV